MATNWEEMTEYFSRETAGRVFEPCAHYDADSDVVTFLFSNEPEHAQRLNSRVTIYLSDETGELVGCRVKGVRSVLEDIGSFDLAISHGKNKLSLLFVALHGTFPTDPNSRGFYRRIGQMLSQNDLEFELPECAV